MTDSSSKNPLVGIVDTLKGAPMTAITAGVATQLLFQPGEISVGGIPLPVSLVGAGGAYVGSMLADKAVKAYLKDHTKIDAASGDYDLQYEVVNGLATSLGAGLAFYFVTGAPVENLIAPSLVCGLSEVVSNYAEKQILGKDSAIPFE